MSNCFWKNLKSDVSLNAFGGKLRSYIFYISNIKNHIKTEEPNPSLVNLKPLFLFMFLLLFCVFFIWHNNSKPGFCWNHLIFFKTFLSRSCSKREHILTKTRSIKAFLVSLLELVYIDLTGCQGLMLLCHSQNASDEDIV